MKKINNFIIKAFEKQVDATELSNSFEYHVFYAYLGINFLLRFMPINQVMSIDRLMKKKEFTRTKTTHNLSNIVNQIYYFLPLYIGIALVYFDSVFFKLSAKSWINGLGVWFPASLPMMVHNNISTFFLGYLILIFEASFIFLFFRKNLRLLLLVIGMGLYVGILGAMQKLKAYK
jgi:hypothetical protein